MKYLQVITLILVALNASCSGEEGTSFLKFFVNLVDDVCNGRRGCADNVLDDLIFLISGDPYDPTDRDNGSSRVTVLLEVIDEKCELDKKCLADLFADMRNRIINEREEFNDDIRDSSLPINRNDNTEVKNSVNEVWEADDDDEFFQEELLDIKNEDQMNNIPDDVFDYDKTDQDKYNQDYDETIFERFEHNKDLDETILNAIAKDECQQNRVECAKFVAREKKLGLNHIGKIFLDENGNPVAKVPKSVIFEAELNVPDGNDEPE